MEVEYQDLNHSDFRPTAESIELLKRKYNEQIFYISGLDQLQFMCDEKKWTKSNINQMFSSCKLFVFQRPSGNGAVDDKEVLSIVKQHEHMQQFIDNKQVIILEKHICAASSTAVRNGDQQWIWPEVWNYI